MSHIRDCFFCNGTGIDECSFDERCIHCSGSGEVDDDDDLDPDDQDDENEPLDLRGTR